MECGSYPLPGYPWTPHFFPARAAFEQLVPNPRIAGRAPTINAPNSPTAPDYRRQDIELRCEARRPDAAASGIRQRERFGCGAEIHRRTCDRIENLAAEVQTDTGRRRQNVTLVDDFAAELEGMVPGDPGRVDGERRPQSGGRGVGQRITQLLQPAQSAAINAGDGRRIGREIECWQPGRFRSVRQLTVWPV